MEQDVIVNMYIEHVHVNTKSDNISDSKNSSEGLVSKEVEGIEVESVTKTNKKFEWFGVVTQILQSVLSMVIARIIIELILK